MSQPKRLAFVTTNSSKREEIELFQNEALLDSGTPIREICEFFIANISVKEILDVDIEVIVRDEVLKAYSMVRVPCVVEHAGLVIEKYLPKNYPGGLTKPMWNVLDDHFVKEIKGASRRVRARSVVGYCNGKKIWTFTGETKGSLVILKRGTRDYYWDPVFIPDKTNGDPGSLTYAEIVTDPKLGLRHKVLELSQATKALKMFVSFLQTNPGDEIFV